MIGSKGSDAAGADDDGNDGNDGDDGDDSTDDDFDTAAESTDNSMVVNGESGDGDARGFGDSNSKGFWCRTCLKQMPWTCDTWLKA